MHYKSIRPHFVDDIPENLEEGILYISMNDFTASHLCCCGCRERVVTPLNPTDWKLKKYGKKVSLYPSIGNWGFECRSHYLIRNNNVIWLYSMTEEQIQYGREMERRYREEYIREIQLNDVAQAIRDKDRNEPQSSFWNFLKWLIGK